MHARDPDALSWKSGGVAGIVQRIAWNGKVEWEWKLSNDRQILHHDIEPLPNGNLLAIGWEVKTPDEARQAGRALHSIHDLGLWPDFVVEIAPSPPTGAERVWEWHVWDHLVRQDAAREPHRVDLNAGVPDPTPTDEEIEALKAMGYLDDEAEAEDLRADFLHINAIDYDPARDELMLSVPILGEIWVIDHGTTTAEAAGPAGDLLYRWGNPAMYGRGTTEDQQLFRQHDARWIAPGHPGAGHVLVFDNGGGRPGGSWSRVLELVLPSGDARYPLDAGQAWGPATPVWTWGEPGGRYAPFVSGAHRLPGGNTFITLGPQSTFIEVTPAGEVVWEYRSPFEGSLTNRDGSSPQPLPDGDWQRAVFRATKLPPDHPGLHRLSRK